MALLIAKFTFLLTDEASDNGKVLHQHFERRFGANVYRAAPDCVMPALKNWIRQINET